MTLRGRDLLTGLPKSVEVSSVELREAICRAGQLRLSKWSKHVAGRDPARTGGRHHGERHHAGGGGALLKGLDRRLAVETRMPVHIAEDPLTCVVRGTGRILEGLEQYSRILRASQATRRVVV